MLRFKFDAEKSIQAIHFLARERPGITQYYVGKVLFFADREHLLDWGRPIVGDRYVAMEHGPVPSNTYDLIKDQAGEPDALADAFAARIRTEAEGNKRHLYSNSEEEFDLLSETDRVYLTESLLRYGAMSFGDLKALSHEDPAYMAAWEQPGLNNEMDPLHWLQQLDDVEQAVVQVSERPTVDKRSLKQLDA